VARPSSRDWKPSKYLGLFVNKGLVGPRGAPLLKAPDIKVLTAGGWGILQFIGFLPTPLGYGLVVDSQRFAVSAI
jgi:hypothetical protein